MKLATLGLATALVFTGSLRARAVQWRLRGRKFGHGRRGNKRHDDGIFHDRNDIRQCDGRHRRHRHDQQRRQCRGRHGTAG